MATNKMSSNRPRPNAAADAVSDDISRIVNYLNANRDNARERATGLAQELAHHAEVAARSPSQSGGFAERLAAVVESLPEQSRSPPVVRAHPMLAEKYHSFCYDLDMLLESFRARLVSKEPIQH